MYSFRVTFITVFSISQKANQNDIAFENYLVK